ncbi:conserved hypothetical protein [Sporisorium reilianum SRZ2]|uniref:Uncharacterized protein n=1 Tax=Sporisorium reilianum (strain SRZ2) TaxID=999809 RepID=E6ZQC0_SPORE|nr:conserved hypothetical protein [Sporisorium reilianum SRZ2]
MTLSPRSDTELVVECIAGGVGAVSAVAPAVDEQAGSVSGAATLGGASSGTASATMLPVKPPKSRKRIDSSSTTHTTRSADQAIHEAGALDHTPSDTATISDHDRTTPSHSDHAPPAEDAHVHSRTPSSSSPASDTGSDSEEEESVTGTSPAVSEVTLQNDADGEVRAKSCDAVCSRGERDAGVERRASLGARVAASGWVQERVNASMHTVKSNEALGRLESDTSEEQVVGGHRQDASDDESASLHGQEAAEIIGEQNEKKDDQDQEVLEWRVEPTVEDEKEQRSLASAPVLPTQDDRTAPAPGQFEASTMDDEVSKATETPSKQEALDGSALAPKGESASAADGDGAPSTRTKGFWSLLSGSSSSASPAITQPTPSTSKRLSTTAFSLFTRKPTAPPLTLPTPAPTRHPLPPPDDATQTTLILSCADARHILKTSQSPTTLQQVGLNLERCFKSQLAQSQDLRARLAAAEDTVYDLEDENAHLRKQLGGLSEQVVVREERVQATKAEMAAEMERVVREGEREREKLRTRCEVQQSAVERRLEEERAFALGLGLMLCEAQRGVSGRGDTATSVLFAGEAADLRRTALAQARPRQLDDDAAAFDYAYADLFRCALHRFPHSAAAPPSTLVDERVLLIGTDQRLLAALVQKLSALGLTRVLVALPSWAETSHKRMGAQTVTVDLGKDDAWTELVDAVRAKLGREADCIVNAFDTLDADQLPALTRLIQQQYTSHRTDDANQAPSIVNIVYDAPSTAMCTLALIGLSHTLTRSPSRPVRLNTLVTHPSSPDPCALDAIVRVIDPCSPAHGCVLAADAASVRCLGPPLCCGAGEGAVLAAKTDEGALRERKRTADAALIEALERENAALRERVRLLEGEAAGKVGGEHVK